MTDITGENDHCLFFQFHFVLLAAVKVFIADTMKQIHAAEA